MGDPKHRLADWYALYAELEWAMNHAVEALVNPGLQAHAEQIADAIEVLAELLKEIVRISRRTSDFEQRTADIERIRAKMKAQTALIDAIVEKVEAL